MLEWNTYEKRNGEMLQQSSTCRLKYSRKSAHDAWTLTTTYLSWLVKGKKWRMDNLTDGNVEYAPLLEPTAEKELIMPTPNLGFRLCYCSSNYCSYLKLMSRKETHSTDQMRDWTRSTIAIDICRKWKDEALCGNQALFN